MITYSLALAPAIPIAVKIVGTIVGGMIQRNLSANAAAKAAAEQYDYFRGLKEAQITQIAIELGQQSDIPYWEWFITLRSLQEFGLLPDPTQPTPPEIQPPLPARPTPPPPEKKKEAGMITGIAIVAALALGFLVTRR